ncbi:acetylxylan esterase [Streptomyces sp. NPDC006235]
MPLTDMPLDELVDYRPECRAPEDFDAFWSRTRASRRAATARPSKPR